MKQRSLLVYLLIAITVLVVAGAVLPNFVVYTDRAFICENTGSRQGWREWCIGMKTGYWYEKSPLEEFIEARAPEALVHRWTSYAGTGKSIIGMVAIQGHGSPGRIMMLRHDILSQWMKANDPAAIRALYDLLVSGDRKQIEERVTQISNQYYLERDASREKPQ